MFAHHGMHCTTYRVIASLVAWCIQEFVVHPARRCLLDAHLCEAIPVHHTEMFGIAVLPFEIIHQSPSKIASDGHLLAWQARRSSFGAFSSNQEFMRLAKVLITINLLCSPPSFDNFHRVMHMLCR